MQTDRYPDSKHKKVQTATPIINAFSVELNLANNPKIVCMVRPATSKWAFPGKATGWPVHVWLIALPIVFAFPQWL